jgi:diacylglycerol kinase
LGVVGAGALLRVERDDWRWLVTAITLVVLAEALNTGIERACDAVTTAHHPMIRMAKDIASTAVLIAVLAAILIGALTFAPYVFGLCG